jgi:hypothetical protein
MRLSPPSSRRCPGSLFEVMLTHDREHREDIAALRDEQLSALAG